MQKPTLIALFCGLLAQHAAIAQDTTWFNATSRATTRDSATSFETIQKTDSGWMVMDYYLSGAIEMTGPYVDEAMKVRQGVFRWYNEKGVVTHLRGYSGGKSSGTETLYDDDGHELLSGENKEGWPEGLWIAYYPSGKIAGKATFTRGRQVSTASLFNEDGSPNPDTVFRRDAEYPGGSAKLQRFLYNNLRYPDYAVRNRIEGVVVVKFHVSKEGHINDLVVIRSAGKLLDAEALRVIRHMPDWSPAVICGVRRSSYERQPVVFSMKGF
jgi:TonB family protein